MKVIDLLNRIANGEEYPKIKFNNSIYEYHDKEHGYCRYYHDNTYICLDTDYYLFDILNDEVEIIEEEPRDIEVCGSLFTRSEYNRLAGIKEDKKIEKLEKYKEIDDDEHYANILKVSKNGEYEITEDMSVVIDKINEIIDKLNKENK